jgi:hypothetical protein
VSIYSWLSFRYQVTKRSLQNLFLVFYLVTKKEIKAFEELFEANQLMLTNPNKITNHFHFSINNLEASNSY